MKMKNFKLFSLALAGVLSMTSLTGCGSNPRYNEEKGCEFTKQFDIGEHIISVPLEADLSEKRMQIESYPGYEIMGVSISTYGQSVSHYAGTIITYSNDEVVECRSNKYDENGDYVYLYFGTPLNYEEDNTASNGTREFDVGEHVISIPITYDVSESNTQYEYHEGYEVLGVTVGIYGQSVKHYGCGVIIYKNSVPVRAKYQEDGYTDFGEPIVKEQVKGLN